MKGTGAAALTGFKGAATGVMNALGGPWGAALTGATVLIGIQQQAAAQNKAAHEKMTQAVHEGKEAQTELASALAGTTGELGEQGLAAAAKVAGGALADFIEKGTHSNSIMENINQSTVAVDEFINKIPGMGTEQSKANTEITKANKAAQDSYKQLEKSMDDLGIPMENLNSVIAQGGDEYENLISKLRDSGDAGNDAADQLEAARGKVDDLIQAGRNMEPAMAQAAEGVKTLADSSSTADDKLSALERTMQALGLAPKDAEQAMMDAAAAVDEITESASEAVDQADGFGDSLFGLDGKLSPTSANARDLAGSLNDMRGELENVAVNGGDTQEAFQNMQPALDALAGQFGLTKEQMQGLIEQYGLMPDKIDTLVNLEGADESTQQLASIAAAVNSVPPGKDVSVGVLDDEAKQRLEDFGYKVENLKDGSSTVRMEDQAALDRYNWWMENGFPAIDAQNPTAKANLDTSGLMYNADYARMQLATVDLERPTPVANMDISLLNSAQIQALQSTGFLNGTRPTPKASMNISELQGYEQMALALCFNLGAQNPTPAASLDVGKVEGNAEQAKSDVSDVDKARAKPKADLDIKPVTDGAKKAQQSIDGIHGKEVQVTFRAEYAGDWDRANRSSGKAHGGYWNGPAYAEGGRHGGYQLPTTGPGTGVTDGFTAFDRKGVPAARLDAGEWIINARSSKKYGKELREINNGTFEKLPGYASGGIAHADEIDKFARGLEGKPYVWGGVNWGDCSGAMSAIARFAVGMEPFAARFATGSQGPALQAMGFSSGRGSAGDLRLGWYNGGAWGGHTAGTLPNGVNVEMGGGRGNGQYGGPAAGAWDSQFTNHAYLRVPTTYVSNLEGMPDTDGFTTGDGTETSRYTSSSSSSSSTSSNAPTSWSDVAGTAGEAFAKGQMQDILGVFGIPDTPPALAAQKQWEEEQAKYNEQVSGASDSGQTSSVNTAQQADVPVVYDATKGADQWKSTVEMALKRVGLALSNTQRTVEQIDIESGGDPNATNDWDSNAANGDPSKGLLQVIGATFQAFRDKDLPNDATHPLANIVAALNYTSKQYGGPEKIWPTRAGYRDGGRVSGPGGRRADRIPAWLSDGEHVVNAASAFANRELLGAINSGFDAQSFLGDAVSSVGELRAAFDDGDAGYGSLSALLGSDRRGLSAANLATDAGGASREVATVVTNNFTAASPDEMYRMYRREAAKSHRGKVGAR